MKLGIQILNYNGMRWLPGLMASLSAGAGKGKQVYIVDNGSSDESLAFIEREYPEVIIIRNNENLGYAAAYNRSMPQAFSDGCDWVCLLNTDTLVESEWLDSIAVAANTDPQLGVLGPVFTEWDSDAPNFYMTARCPDVIPFMFDATHEPVDRDWVEGSVFFINRQCYEDIGGLNPLYFMYWEEADYCRRARYHGWRVAVVPGSVCKHYAGGSATEGGTDFLQIRNHFYFKLTDPNHTFARNILSAARLGLTYTKLNLWDKPDARKLGHVLKAFASAGLHILSCFQSWKSDSVYGR